MKIFKHLLLCIVLLPACSKTDAGRVSVKYRVIYNESTTMASVTYKKPDGINERISINKNFEFEFKANPGFQAELVAEGGHFLDSVNSVPWRGIKPVSAEIIVDGKIVESFYNVKGRSHLYHKVN